MVTSRGNKRSTGRGFSLIELLVVMFIIGLVVAITIPALGFARTLAKKTSTQTFMNGLSQACTVFQNDNRRVPGYFSPREMGSDENRAIGFTAMDNVLLDLSGGVTTTPANGTTVFALGPTAAGKVNVDPDRIGIPSSSGKIYWTPDAKYYETQVALGKVGDPLNLRLKSVIDAFGQPLLFWANDDASITPLTAANPLSFARDTSGVNGSTPARFYSVGNSAYLGSTLLGKRGRDQTLSSLYSTTSLNDQSRIMAAFLGNPSAIANPSDPQVSWVPSAGRGKFMIHSAGNDAVFLSKEDGGYKKHGGTAMTYASNFVAGSTKPIDIASDFDDLLVSGGN